MEKKQYAQKLLTFLDNAPSPYQSVDLLSAMLDEAGAVKLEEFGVWSLEAGKLYYFVKDGTQIMAFHLGSEPLAETGFRMASAHHDYPGLRIKPAGSSVELNFERLSVEGYGGVVTRGWFDRPLAVAGRLFVKAEGGVKSVNVNLHEPLLIIPSPAIHIDRTINENAKVSMNTDMRPVFCLNEGGEKSFIPYLAERVGVKAEDVLSFELNPYEYQPGCFVGKDEEFISTGRLDDVALSYAAFCGLLEAKESKYSCIAVAYDHEEIGSASTRGARSNSLMMTIDRICEKLGMSAEDKYRTIANSVMFSADQAHATHPAHVDKADPNHKIALNKGPVLKVAQYQSYATSPRGTAIFKWVCENNGIPYQVFTNHSDARGGGTIGPVLASAHGMTTVDIGNPMLGMHAIRELGGTDDHYYMVKLFKALFETDLSVIGR